MGKCNVELKKKQKNITFVCHSKRRVCNAHINQTYCAMCVRAADTRL